MGSNLWRSDEPASVLFVFLLSFSEMDRNKYRVVSGSVKNAFGIQCKKPVFESHKGSKMIAKEFDQAILLTKIEDFVKPIIIELEVRTRS